MVAIMVLAWIAGVSATMAVFRWREAGRERVAALLVGPQPAQVRAEVRRDRVAERIPLVRRLQVAAIQAGVDVKGEGVLIGSVGAAAFGYGLLLWLTASPLFAAGGLLLGVLAPVAGLRVMRARRAPVIGAQLPGALRLWATALRSGRSTDGALVAAMRETPDPLATELGVAVAAMAAQEPPGKAMDRLAERLGHRDAKLVASAVRLHEQLGGELAKPLLSVAETAQDRVALRAAVSAKTAQVRIGAYIVLAMPVLMLTIFQIHDHGYISALTGTPQGVRMLVIAAALMGMAVVWIRGILRTATVD